MDYRIPKKEHPFDVNIRFAGYTALAAFVLWMTWGKPVHAWAYALVIHLVMLDALIENSRSTALGTNPTPPWLQWVITVGGIVFYYLVLLSSVSVSKDVLFWHLVGSCIVNVGIFMATAGPVVTGEREARTFEEKGMRSFAEEERFEAIPWEVACNFSLCLAICSLAGTVATLFFILVRI